MHITTVVFPIMSALTRKVDPDETVNTRNRAAARRRSGSDDDDECAPPPHKRGARHGRGGRWANLHATPALSGPVGAASSASR